MIDWLKKYWMVITIIISGIIIIPILLNFILLIPCNLPIIGNSTDWLRFWASYLGIIIAIIVPSCVCYYSIRENRTSRKELIKKEALLNFRKICLRCIHFYNLKLISERILYALDIRDLENCIKEQNNEVEKVHIDFILNFDKKSKNALQLLTLELKCYKFQKEFLKDAFAFIHSFKYFKEKEIFKGFVLKHKFTKEIPNISQYIDIHFNNLDLFIILLIGELLGLYIKDEEISNITKFIECIGETFDLDNIYLESLKYGTEQDK
ncbi:MAG: hypothetical protein J1E82_04890 [Muribaculaceae bacterium]|nr:hypothetical protein [Muribaculaceae bacterium]